MDQSQTQDLLRDSSHCSMSPPSHRMISIISSTQDFPHREPPLRIWVMQTRSTQLLSPTNTTSKQHARQNNNQPLTRGILNHHFHNHLSLEGYQHYHLSLEGYHKVWKVTTLGGLSQPQTNFLTKTRSYR